MAIFSNFITTRAGFPNNEISTGNLFISASSITSSAAQGRDELVANTITGVQNTTGQYRLSAFTTIDTRLPLVTRYPPNPEQLIDSRGLPLPWNALTAATNVQTTPSYYPTLLHVKGNQDSSQVYPPDPFFVSFPLTSRPLGLATFAPNVALLVSGGLHIANSIYGFNTIEGITHIPANNALVVGGKIKDIITQVVNYRRTFNESNHSSRLTDNITIFGGGMGARGTGSGQHREYTNAFLSGADQTEAGSGLNMWGFCDYARSLYGIRFEMANLYGDPDGSRFGRSFAIRVANPWVNSLIAGTFGSDLSILQYSFIKNELTIGTVSDANSNDRGKTRLISGNQIEITSTLQIGQYRQERSTVSGSILYAAFKHRFAGSNTAGQQSELYFDNVQLYATSSVLPNFGTDYQYALAVRSGSGLYAGNPNVWQIGLGIVSASGGGGASLFPGGNNYDIQYNVTQGGASPRFGGANEINQTFEYVYDATPDPLFRYDGRMQGGGASATGLGSRAFGDFVVASGKGAHAEGLRTTASGDFSHAEGNRTTASGQNSHAEGRQTLASGENSHAEGRQTIASALNAHAEGLESQATNQYAHAEGFQTLASGIGSHAEGQNTIATSFYDHAEGAYTTASGGWSHAEGYLTYASANFSHAEGIGTITSASGQHAEGKYNIPSSTAIWVLGDGVSTSSRHNLIEGHTGQVRFSGSLFVQPGQGYLPFASQSTVLTYNPTTGQIQLMYTSSIAGGGVQPQYWIQDGTRLYTSGGFKDVQVTGSIYALGDAHTFVGTTTVSGGLFIQPRFVPTTVVTSGGANPMILAYNTTTGQVQKTTLTAVGAAAAPPSWSIQFNRGGNFGGTQFFIYSESVNTVFAATQFNIGLQNRVNQNTYGIVMGSQSFAQGIGSFAQGFQVTASGVYSHAQGSASLASGIYSHAEGRQTLAGGRYSHAEGYLTSASDDYTHAEGQETRAIGNASHAEGVLTLANAIGAHAEGREVTASGAYSHAEGFKTKALYEYAHAEGGATIASGSYAHAEGQGTEALADGAHAEGWFTKATGRYAHAEGFNTLAQGEFSTARGRQATASGDWSQASGFQVTALAPYQQVFGQYNTTLTDTGSILIIGAGTNARRKNALVFSTASMIFSSSLYFADGTDFTTGQPFLPRASQSLMFVYDQATGQVELMHTSSLPKDGYWIQNGPTLFTSGGFSTVSVTGSLFLSGSSTYQGMRSDLVTKTAVNGYQMLTGSNNTMHIAPGGQFNERTVYFPTTPTYGTTFTLVVDSPGIVTIETGSRLTGTDPIYRIQAPASTTFAGAVYANTFGIGTGVYNYMYLNVSSGSIGNAWVLTSKM